MFLLKFKSEGLIKQRDNQSAICFADWLYFIIPRMKLFNKKEI